jgi:hypothetical protein
MPMKKGIDDISREEDFRDYDDRNIDEGWPYADEPGAASAPAGNTAYGHRSDASDKQGNPGFLLDEATADGLEEAPRDGVRPATVGLEEADDLEERLTDAIDALGIIDMDLIDVRVQGGVVTIEGEVDDRITANRIFREIQQVSGVHKVVSHLRLEGVDSRIPDED